MNPTRAARLCPEVFFKALHGAGEDFRRELLQQFGSAIPPLLRRALFPAANDRLRPTTNNGGRFIEVCPKTSAIVVGQYGITSTKFLRKVSLKDCESKVSSAALSQDGTTAAAVLEGGTIRVWNNVNPRLRASPASWEFERPGAMYVSVSGDGRTIAAFDAQGISVHAINEQTQSLVKELESPPGIINLALNQHGDRIALVNRLELSNSEFASFGTKSVWDWHGRILDVASGQSVKETTKPNFAIFSDEVPATSECTFTWVERKVLCCLGGKFKQIHELSEH